LLLLAHCFLLLLARKCWLSEQQARFDFSHSRASACFQLTCSLGSLDVLSSNTETDKILVCVL